MSHDPLNDPHPGDQGNGLLRKILSRLSDGTVTVSPQIVIESGDVVIGTVSVDNFPAVQAVTVGNFPASFEVSNFPADQGVTVSNFPATQPVSGTVAVSNFPATQPVSGTVTVANISEEIFEPLFNAAVSGEIDGRVARSYHVMGRRSGFNSTSVLQDVGEFLGTSINALPELTGVENLEVVSTAATDTAAGVGARTVRIGYINTSNALVESADIVLNGVTPVALGFQAKFILWMETSTVGSNEVAVGNILLRIAGAGATHEQITAGGNRSLSCRFMVPTGYTGYLSGWGSWAVGTSQDVRLRATVHSGDRSLGTAYIFQSVAYLSAGGSADEGLPWLVCPALSKIKVSTISGAAPAGNRIDTEFTILLIANP